MNLTDLKNKLATPSDALIRDMASLGGDVIVLGAAGKIGPNIIRLLAQADQQAGVKRRVYAVSRFSNRERIAELAAAGAINCEIDVTSDNALRSLPDAPNVIYMIGSRFGMAGKESQMWYVNTVLPGQVVERFNSSRIVAVSTGNVYPLVSVDSSWPTEDTLPAPVGEYAMSCLGRERVMAHFAGRRDTPLAIVRLNYSIEMRYGPIVDLARLIASGKPVDLSMGFLNVVWQGYSNEVILRCLLRAASPPCILNVTGPELVSVRETAIRIATLLGQDVMFMNAEAPTALLSDARYCHHLFGLPAISLDTMVTDTVRWIADGLPLFNLSTGFQSRNGKF